MSKEIIKDLRKLRSKAFKEAFIEYLCKTYSVDIPFEDEKNYERTKLNELVEYLIEIIVFFSENSNIPSEV
jgi:predicted site-specific integrase-resolvase